MKQKYNKDNENKQIELQKLEESRLKELDEKNKRQQGALDELIISNNKANQERKNQQKKEEEEQKKLKSRNASIQLQQIICKQKWEGKEDQLREFYMKYKTKYDLCTSEGQKDFLEAFEKAYGEITKSDMNTSTDNIYK